MGAASSSGLYEIASSKFPAYRQAGKSQTNSKLQSQMTKTVLFRILNLGNLKLFVIWCLLFGA